MKPVSENYIAQCFGLGETPVETFKDPNAALQQASQGEYALDCNTWLPFAAKEYCLSPDIRDYVLVPVPVMFTDIPNTNGDSVTIGEFLRFDTDMGMQAFKTFRGKGCYVEHANKDVTKALGVILDVYLRPLKKFGNGRYYKLVELMAYDRTKDPLFVNSILSGENNAYSVGFYFKSYKCSICGMEVAQGGEACTHTFPRRPTYKNNMGKLVYRQCRTITGFETSSVGNPSYVTAIQNGVMNPKMMF